MTIVYSVPSSEILQMADSYLRCVANLLDAKLEYSTIASVANDVVEHVEMVFDTDNVRDMKEFRAFVMQSVIHRMAPYAEAQ